MTASPIVRPIPASREEDAPGRPRRAALRRLRLRDFRGYVALSLDLDGRSVVLTGPNGAGKTNLLEAISFLAPGRGLRRAKLGEITRHGGKSGWAVATRIATPEGEIEVGTGILGAGTGDRRVVRIDGAQASGAAQLPNHFGVQWLTPQMDRLFEEGPGPRRRFLDRLVHGSDPGHARRVADYERCLRERSRLLREGRGDDAWLGALEAELAACGVAVAVARRDAVARLGAALGERRGDLPQAEVQARGGVEDWIAEMPALEVESRLAEGLRDHRARDRESGGAGLGPHLSDFAVRHAGKGLPAALCSTGEQKALLIAIVLANARVETARRGRPPILLLDEVAAHLDGARREGLMEEIFELGGQAWFTGTEPELFRALLGRAQFLAVEAATIVSEDRGFE